VDAETALKNPEDTIVSVQGSDTSLAAAINGGLVKVENGQIVETNWNQPAESKPEPTRTNYLSDQAQKFIKAAREAGNFDETFAGVLAHAGKAEGDSASRAALTRFGHEVGSPNYDRAVETANNLITDVMESTESAIADKFGDSTAERAIDWMMNSMSVESRVRCFQAVLHGDPHAIDYIVEASQLKNR
jgi:hypothetical protein